MALARRNIAGCCLKELFRQQGTLGGIRAGEVLPEKGVQALMPDARTRHDRFCEASLQAPMDIHRRQTGRLGHIISRSEEHTSELQSLMRFSYAVFCFKKTNNHI